MAIGIATTISEGAKIKIIGVGGGGCNAVHNMVASGLQGIEFIIANTDKQSLDNKNADKKIQLGKKTTNGLGSGGKPEIGKKSTEEDESEIKEALAGSNMVFVATGMGGGTGSGASPEIARIAKEMGILVVGIVTKPFEWEGVKKMSTAINYIEILRNHVDALIVIPNQRLLQIIDHNVSFTEAFKKVDEVLHNATKGITEIIGNHGEVNIDFADVTSVMKNSGDAIMGIGYATGEKRTELALTNALHSPLLDGASIRGAKGVLVNFTAGKDLSMFEISEAVRTIHETAGEDVNLKFGVVQNPNMNNEIMVTVVATGFNANREEQVIEIPKVEKVTEVKPKPIVGVTPPIFIPESTKEPRTIFPPNPTRTPQSTWGTGRTTFSQSANVKIGGNSFDSVIPSANYYDTVPKGTEEVKRFDAPAFARKGLICQITEVSGTNRINFLQQA